MSKLTRNAIVQIDFLLTTDEVTETEQEESEKRGRKAIAPARLKTSDFAFLKTDPGAVGLDSFLTEIKKLKLIRTIGLPADLFGETNQKLVKIYRQRAATESPNDIRRHKDAIRYTLMAAFCSQRSQEITDSLIEILTTIIKRIDNRAEKRINQELIEEFKIEKNQHGNRWRELSRFNLCAP